MTMQVLQSEHQISDAIEYQVSPFKAVTSISLIEHRFNPRAPLTEISRLLRPGGGLIASMDYRPEKIDTIGTSFFDMDWLILSRADVERFIESAAAFGLRPTGALELSAKEKVIHYAGKAYTFAALVMTKAA